MKRKKCGYSACVVLFCLVCSAAFPQGAADSINVEFTPDFTVSCDNLSKNWEKATWVTLDPNHADSRTTRIKLLYSSTGIYCLFQNGDKNITVSGRKKDFDSLWVEDVVEAFLWPDTSMSVYFEYELSPLNRELVLIIPNFNGTFVGWQPWQYHGDRKIKHCTKVLPAQRSGVGVKDWYAEFFIPYALLFPMVKEPPSSGAVWRANFYRADYDDNKTIEWSWKRTEKTFHEYRKFGRLTFR